MATSTGPEGDEGESSNISLSRSNDNNTAKKRPVKANTSHSPLNASHSMVRRSEKAKRDANSSPSSNDGKRKPKKRKFK